MKNMFVFVVLAFAGGQLTFAQISTLWATTAGGGAHGFGTILKSDSSGHNFQAVYSFDSLNGSYPAGDLVQGTNGKIYGTTLRGSLNDLPTIFSYNPVANTSTVIYNLEENNRYGGWPMGGMTAAPNGKLYGVASSSGLYGYGIIYSIDPVNNTFADEYDFTGDSGSAPSSEMMLANDGKLYGVTGSGGLANNGVIFNFNPINNDFKVLYNYADSEFNSDYVSMVQAMDGKLYGISARTSPGSGNFYIFSLDLITNTFTDVYDFLDSTAPSSGLVMANSGKLYGVTEPGHLASLGYSYIYSFDVTTQAFAQLAGFDYNRDYYQTEGLTKLLNGKLAGSAPFGGQYSCGLLYDFDVTTNTFTSLLQSDSATTGYFAIGKILETDIIATGVNEPAPPLQLKVWPNPATDVLYVQNTGAGVPFTITNILGTAISRGLFTGKQQVIDVSQLPIGIYLINKTRFVKE